eukprot:m51a1_g8237 hypothetical protein (377) ;mRNA; r:83529-84725
METRSNAPHESSSMSVTLAVGASEETAQLIEPLSFGTSGLGYRFADVRRVLSEAVEHSDGGQLLVPQCRSREGELLGLACVVPQHPGPLGTVFYLTVFSTKASARGMGVGRKVLAQGLELVRQRAAAMALEAQPSVLWLTVETANVRSSKNFRALAPAVRSVRVLQPLGACFASPRLRQDVYGTASSPEELADLVRRLRAQHDEQGALDLCWHPKAETYKVVRDSTGRIVAGADATTVVRLAPSGFINWWDRHAHTLLSAMGTMYSRDGTCSVAALSNPFCEPGHEAEFYTLLECVQAEAGAGCVAMYFDPADDVFRRLKKFASSHLAAAGLLGSVVTASSPPSEVFATAMNPQSEGLLAKMEKAPVLIVPFHGGW